MAPSTSRFTLSGIALPEGEDPLGLWTLPESSGVSFSAEAAPVEPPTWHIELSSSAEETRQVLDAQTRALALGERDLEQAKDALKALGTTEAVSFATDDPLAAQKAALLETLQKGQEPVAYGVEPQAEAEQEEVYRQWLAFMEQTRELLSHYARIKTTAGETLIGITEVSWGGDFKTEWPADLPAASMQQHLQAVHLALGSRIALMRVFSVVGTGAAGLAVKATMPGAQILLLPATWKFVRDVLQELRKSWPQIQSLI